MQRFSRMASQESRQRTSERSRALGNPPQRSYHLPAPAVGVGQGAGRPRGGGRAGGRGAAAEGAARGASQATGMMHVMHRMR